MKSSQYWARRMTQMAQRQMQSDEAVERRVARAYDELMHDLDRELSVFYARYAANEGISMAAARKLLSGAELENFRMTLEEFRDKAKAGGYDRELNEIYLRSRVSRLQALQTQITVRTRELYQSQRDLLHDHIKATYADTFTGRCTRCKGAGASPRNSPSWTLRPLRRSFPVRGSKATFQGAYGQTATSC